MSCLKKNDSWDQRRVEGAETYRGDTQWKHSGGKTEILTYGLWFPCSRTASLCCKRTVLWQENKMQLHCHSVLSQRQDSSPFSFPLHAETRCAVGFELCFCAVLITVVFQLVRVLGWKLFLIKTVPMFAGSRRQQVVLLVASYLFHPPFALQKKTANVLQLDVEPAQL